LRLLEEGKPVPAQFTALEEGYTEVDFNVNHGPFEVRRYRVEEGGGPEISRGIRLEQRAESFVVRYPGGLEFHVPKNLLGLLNAVKTPSRSYLRTGSRGLVLNYRDDIQYRAGGIGHSGTTKARVVKAGPLAVMLRFESMEGLRVNRRLRSVVEMEFPRSKSWVEVRWKVEDPERGVSGMTADLELDLDGKPTVVDFGAGSMVYAALRDNRPALFWADLPPSGQPSWQIEVGGRSYAAGRGGPVEGWAHIMDSRRATAVAVAEFAKFFPTSRDSIRVWPDGRLQIRRDFRRGREKSLTFWLHFVEMPVAVGAATSPQSMQHPPLVEWE
jgi:hypothetical protein